MFLPFLPSVLVQILMQSLLSAYHRLQDDKRNMLLLILVPMENKFKLKKPLCHLNVKK